VHVAPPLPDVDDPFNEPFWTAVHEHRLVVQHCSVCDTPRHPPRPACANCGSFQYDWRTVSGRATVWSFIVLHPPVIPAFESRTPVPVVVVELTLDHPHPIRMVGRIDTRGITEDDWRALLQVGAPVEATYEEEAPDVTLVSWKLLGSDAPSGAGR
jgi:uncharacterized OB-fold protein